jgi:hypothetical protein
LLTIGAASLLRIDNRSTRDCNRCCSDSDSFPHIPPLMRAPMTTVQIEKRKALQIKVLLDYTATDARFLRKIDSGSCCQSGFLRERPQRART